MAEKTYTEQQNIKYKKKLNELLDIINNKYGGVFVPEGPNTKRLFHHGLMIC